MVMLYVNLFCEEGKPGQVMNSCRIAGSCCKSFWQLRLEGTFCGLPCCMSTGCWFGKEEDKIPWPDAAVLKLLQKVMVRKAAGRSPLLSSK